MKRNFKQGAFFIIAIIVASYSLHKNIWAEYRTKNTSIPYYLFLNWWEKILDWIGYPLRLLVPILFGYVFFVGANSLYTKHLSKYNKTLVFIVAIWLFIMGLYALTTVAFIRDLILNPLFGLEIDVHF